jgi:hypothetical protein
MHNEIMKKIGGAAPTLPKKEEPVRTYVGLELTDGTPVTADHLKRALTDFTFYRKNSEALLAARRIDRDEAKQAEEDARNAEAKRRWKDSKLRVEAERQLAVEQREREAEKAQEKEAEIQARMELLREAQQGPR